MSGSEGSVRETTRHRTRSSSRAVGMRMLRVSWAVESW